MTMLLALLLLAQAPEIKPPEVKGELPAAASIHARKRVSPDLRNVEGKFVAPGNEVLADDMVDEMVDEFAADVARLGASGVGPILIERIRVSDNVNPAYAGVLEARLVAAVLRAASVAVVRCVECTATRSRVDNGDWVVSRGITTREEAQAIAHKYGARSFLDVALSVREKPASMGMDVEMVRTEDASIAFAERYRFDGAQGMLYRGADSAQSREEKLKQLQDRLNQRPRWGQALDMGVMWILGGSNTTWGGVGRVQITEEFGEDREFQAGISGGGFINPSTLQGGLASAVVQVRIGRDDILAPKFWVGMDGGVLLTGSGTAPLIGGSLKWLVGQRFALRFALRYVGTLNIPNSTATYGGGIAPEMGVSFVWN
jgi:predicted methyltransferase MtxX (methanogen marker protein 4)